MVKKILKAAVFVMVLAMILSFAGILNAEPDTYELTSQDKVILTQPAVCYVTSIVFAYVLDANTNEWSEQYYYGPFGGTGFCVNPDTGHIITAAHVVDISEYEAKLAILDAYIFDTYPDDYYNLTDSEWNWIYDNYSVEGSDSSELDTEVWVQLNIANAGVPDASNSDYIRAEVVDSSPIEQRDIAILQIQPQTGRSLSSVLIGDSSSVEIQDALTIIGYPWTSEIGQNNVLNPTITNGNVSGKIMLNGTEVLQIQGDARAGNSGGPVLSQDGEVMGILTMATDDTNNYLRPANDVTEMLNRNGVANKLGMVDEEFKQGLINYRLKHYSKAMEHFNAVLNLNQRHLQAQDYRSKSQEAINKGEDIPIEEEQTIEIVEPETTEAETTGNEAASGATEAQDGEEESSGAGLAIWIIIILFVVVPLVFIILIVVIIIIVVRKKKASAAPTVAAPTTAPKAEPQKAKVTEKKTTVKGKFCPNCGNQIKDGVKFCSSCGNKVD